MKFNVEMNNLILVIGMYSHDLCAPVAN